MLFDLDLKSGIPIYIQLKEKIKLAVATGKYPPGAQLPTVRQMAVDLRINANTVARVYSELESEGFLATRQGKGTFVREITEIKADDREKSLQDLIDTLLIECASRGFAPELLLTELEKRIKNKQ
ncbi:MAG: HTH-type transcriptional repressor YtrA [Pelotomaculum sp. PtaB.Bin013]|uniref:GntR family transcriptional regulator n=1 Tax=Pelotomaculum isophthalicicum JI TaxID=947010 RepID=A0A9X4H265_9FIRM|nr:GntR family transcriptional regulator [Pelotomaculum isophthalicicum]MDF9407053.1 GntR family transcriptional regulator [Pelotomaculum isophthalicicum JI]OPX90348.1 MAG: HTH-type transcriptional repressor YtrA [Pelotomaculum sp. PtaB.Bin013]